jgi:HAD superfamily hydrolase (TIGR01549 family)
MTPKKAWLIDLDGTLYPAGPLKLAMAAELALLGAPAISILKEFRRHHELVREDLLADPDLHFVPSAFHEQLRRAAAEAGTTEERVHEHVVEWMTLRPGKWMRLFRLKTLLRRIEVFRESGGKTAVVSDYPAEPKLERMRVRHLFDCVVASGEHPELRRLKPAPDAFLIAARTLGVQPDECLIIGDRQDADGEAARAANMAFELIE